jgi:hypothetical protein
VGRRKLWAIVNMVRDRQELVDFLFFFDPKVPEAALFISRWVTLTSRPLTNWGITDKATTFTEKTLGLKMEKQSSPSSSPPLSGDLAARESTPPPGNMPLGVVSTMGPELGSENNFHKSTGTQRRLGGAEEDELMVSSAPKQKVAQEVTDSCGDRRRRL